MSNNPDKMHDSSRGRIIVLLALGLPIIFWFAVSFLTPEPVHKEDTGPINYYGVAEVLDIAETPRKCFIYIRRDSGKETREKMARTSCRKLHVGDVINIENGEYVSTVSSAYK